MTSLVRCVPRLQSSLVDYRVATRLDPENEAYRKMVSKLIDMQVCGERAVDAGVEGGVSTVHNACPAPPAPCAIP